MCNLYTLDKNVDAVRRLFAEHQIPLEFPEGIPNFQPRDVRITERAPIVKFDRDRGVAQLVERRWSWPRAGGQAGVQYALGRPRIRRDRCLVLADAFYEFTSPSDPKQKRKDCWLLPASWRIRHCRAGADDPEVGEAFTLLTVPPGDDIAPLPQPPDRIARPAALARVARRLGAVDGTAAAE